MTKASDASLVRCQPGMKTSSPGPSTTTVYRGRPVVASFTSLNAYKLSPSIVSVTAASSLDLLTSLTPNTSPRANGTNASPFSTFAVRGLDSAPARAAQTSTAYGLSAADTRGPRTCTFGVSRLFSSSAFRSAGGRSVGSLAVAPKSAASTVSLNTPRVNVNSTWPERSVTAPLIRAASRPDALSLTSSNSPLTPTAALRFTATLFLASSSASVLAIAGPPLADSWAGPVNSPTAIASWPRPFTASAIALATTASSVR